MTKTARPAGVNAFYLALSLIIMGVGFLKPNISTIVGQLYPQGDPAARFRLHPLLLRHQPRGLLGLGAVRLPGPDGRLVGRLRPGRRRHGCWASSSSCSASRCSKGKGEPPDPELLEAPLVGPLNREWLIYLLGVLGVGLVWFLVQRNALVGCGAGHLHGRCRWRYIVWFMHRQVCRPRSQRERMMLAMVLIFGAVVFFTLFEQAGTSLNLFADRNVDLQPDADGVTSFLGLTVGTAGAAGRGRHHARPAVGLDRHHHHGGPDPVVQRRLHPDLRADLRRAVGLARPARNWIPNPTLKFGLGLIQVGLGFLVVVWGAGMADASLPPAADAPGPALPAAHDGRAVPVAGRACRRSPSSRCRRWSPS